MRFFIAQRPYVISFGWVSFLVGKPVVELVASGPSDSTLCFPGGDAHCSLL